MDTQHEFTEIVWEYYRRHGRDLPWRQEPFSPYNILVSEVMLQQTQVPRVIPKYRTFLELFPTTQALANAQLSNVIRAWSGLGYNRRAKYLHDVAKLLVSKPVWTVDDLVACKGIGFNTAAAVVTYAYNQPMVFIETNIRTVYIHHFFADRTDVSDKELLPLVQATLDQEHPREFMWALMDYGSYLKSTVGNASRFSKHHTIQSKFEGSHRQIRGQVLRLLQDEPKSLGQLASDIADSRLSSVLQELEAEGLVRQTHKTYRLAD